MTEIKTTVYVADGNMPLELAEVNTPNVCRDIIVGTRLITIVGSDTNGCWSGDL